MPQSRKIALIIAGGVSLGSYEAGVLTELLYLLDQYNKRKNEERFVIDVITGGSAGSINGALVASAIMHNFENRSALRDLWLRDADISELLKSDSKRSLFSSKFQEFVAAKYLNISDQSVKPASFAPKKLKLAFSLSNMVGVDFGFPYSFASKQVNDSDGGQFIWTFFSDYLTTEVTDEDPVNVGQWDLIKQSAVASGGFPVAFPPYHLLRRESDFPGSLPSQHLPGEHAISDGGMFDNEPVKKAIRLAAELDGGRPSEDRLFILIDPTINASRQSAKFANPDQQTSLVENVSRLLMMALSEAEAKDWLRAGKINKQLQCNEKFAYTLSRLINLLPADSMDELKASVGNSSEEIHQLQRVNSSDIPRLDSGTALQESLELTKQKYREQYFATGVAGESQEMFEKRRSIFTNLLYASESAGNLQYKSDINLFLIGADKTQLAGRDFFSLAGFFERDWRDHDFRFGRKIAHELVPEFLGESKINREQSVAYEPEHHWGDLTQVEIKDANPDARNTFIERAADLIYEVLRKPPFELGWLAGRLIRYFAKSKLKKQLGE